MSPLTFPDSSVSIHSVAIAVLLGQNDHERELRQADYAYLVSGRKGGSLCYRKGHDARWVLVANWCFFHSYVAVRHRKARWLRPMYGELFSRINYRVSSFDEHTIEILSSTGERMGHRLFRLGPPSAMEGMLREKFGFTEQQLKSLGDENLL